MVALKSESGIEVPGAYVYRPAKFKSGKWDCISIPLRHSEEFETLVPRDPPLPGSAFMYLEPESVVTFLRHEFDPAQASGLGQPSLGRRRSVPQSTPIGRHRYWVLFQGTVYQVGYNRGWHSEDYIRAWHQSFQALETARTVILTQEVQDGPGKVG